MSESSLPMLPKLPARPDDGHKGTFGTVGIVGGSVGGTRAEETESARMIGAPALVAMGTNRAGCGLVKIAAAEPILNAVLTLAPMATGYAIQTSSNGELVHEHAMRVIDQLAAESDVMVVGPGLGTRDDTRSLVNSLLGHDRSSRMHTLVLDADALTVLAQSADDASIDICSTRLILTPHPGEARRLLDAFGIEGKPDGTAEERLGACIALARAINGIVVLKGHATVVADPSTSWVCRHGSPCLGSGGTGDVLAGMIGSIVAQSQGTRSGSGLGLFSVFDAVCIAVEAHARCGEQWSDSAGSDAGLDPRDLGTLIPNILGHYRRSKSDS